MTEYEIKQTDDTINAYKNMIRYFKKQILDLERRKITVSEECKECFEFKFKVTNKK